MSPQKLLIIETSDIGARYTAEASIRLGFDPVFLCCLSNYQEDTLKQIKNYEHFNLATSSSHDLSEFVKSKDWNVFGVVTLLDSRIEVAVQLADLLGVRGLDPCAALFKDKLLAYSLSPENFPETMAFNRSSIPLAALENMLDEHGAIVIKPRYTAGAIGFQKIVAKDELPKAVKEIQSTVIPAFLNPDLWLAQRCVEGSLVSVEGFVQDGIVHVLGLSGRKKIANTETVITFPATVTEVLSKQLEIEDRCRNFVQKTKMKNGFFHVEMVVTESRSFIIDPNLGRIGGGGLGEQMALAFEYRPEDFYAEILKISLCLLNSTSSIAGKKIEKSTASVMYGLQESGYVRKIFGPSPLKSNHTVIWGPDQIVMAQGKNNWSWVGIMTGVVPDIYKEVDSLIIQTQRGLEHPIY